MGSLGIILNGFGIIFGLNHFGSIWPSKFWWFWVLEGGGRTPSKLGVVHAGVGMVTPCGSISKVVGWTPKSIDEDKSSKTSIENNGAVVDRAKFNTETSKVMWVVKFHGERGLIPVKPVVAITVQLTVPAAHAVEFLPAA